MNELDRLKKEREELRKIVNNHEKEIEKRKRRFIYMLGLSGLTVLLTAFILTLIGAIDLRIVNDVRVPAWIDFIGNFVMFMINMYFVFSITLRVFDKRKWFILLGYVPIYILKYFLIPVQIFGLIHSFIIPLIYCIVLTIILSKIKNNIQLNKYTILCYIISFVFIPIYQLLSGIVKLYGFGLYYYNCNILSTLLYSIDLYIVFILLKWVVKNNVLGNIRRRRKFLLFAKDKSVPVDSETLQALTNGMTRRQAVMFYILAMGYQMLQLIVVLAIGKINNMFIELLAMLIIFWIGRTILGKCWHSDKLWVCSVATFTGFYILTKCTLPLSVSLFACISLSGAFTYLMYYLGVKQEKYKEYEQICDKEKIFRDKCFQAGLSNIKTEIAVDYLINGMSIKDQSIKYEYTESTIKKYRQKIKDKIK